MEPQMHKGTKSKETTTSQALDPEKAYSGFSVDDIEEAEDFYCNKLGFDAEKSEMGILNLHLGDNDIFVYPKENHEPATFTILNFEVDNIEKAMDQLKDQGITFEQYEGEIKTDEKGIFRHGSDGLAIAWFKDPAGNILSVFQEAE